MTSKSMFGCVRIFKNNLLSAQNRCSVHSSVNGVTIPARIERGPTDILKALSNTISPQHITYKAQYGVLWDGLDNFQDSYHSMAQESGRKAAKWIVSENPNFFKHKVAEPYIEAFAPPKVLDNTSEVSEETLINAIQMIHVKYAIEVYKLLKERGIDVSKATKQKLLELVCYFNCKDKPDATLVATNWYSKTSVVECEWEENDFHMQLFNEMEHDAQSYSAVILGCFKHRNYTLASQLFNEAKTNGIKFGVEVYNEHIEKFFGMGGKFVGGENTVLKLLNELAELKIEPNLDTLNGALKLILSMKFPGCENFCLKVVNEFRRIGINPSLGTYFFLISILFNKSSDRKKFPVKIFTSILDELEGKKLKIESEHDLGFFPKAMEKLYNIERFDLAKRLDKILNTGYNKAFLCFRYNMAIYYRFFLLNALKCGTLDEVPHFFERISATLILSGNNFEEIISVLEERTNGEKLLPAIWYTVKKMRCINFLRVMDTFLTVLDEKGCQMDKDTDLKLAKDIWDDCKRIFSDYRWDSGSVSRLISIFSRKKDGKYAFQVFDFVLNSTEPAIALDLSSSIDFIKLCAVYEDKKRAMECVVHSCENHFSSINELIGCLRSSFKLDQDDWNKLNRHITPLAESDNTLII